MLIIPKNIHDALIVHAQRDFPLEACGILGGLNGLVSDHYPMANSDRSNEHFMMEPKEQFSVVKELRAKGKVMLAIYHSHPETPARPSEEDIRLALTPDVSHVIISLAGETPEIKAYRIEGGIVTPEPISISG
ncbi:M67 family metallopeptidase [Geobacter pelophilus]|uniref:M67 family metallopeptidase n=1 Tax=Geoanaerobacter pelophilus TaxID=60036 RepID=A0AAW4L0R7_9BACT|nr:M67 family metallopeptidase [Geoanaerobacter pelophilus]MBT0664654.1 M67 family metallopeptidase [Geoanaerobacter pelophilus]